MSRAPVTQAKNAVAALLHDARAAGWVRARFVIQPDGSVIIDAGMTDQDGGDDFTSTDLRMGK